MSNKRKNYQRRWVSNKRKSLRVHGKLNTAIAQSSDSDINEDSVDIVPVINTTRNVDLVCFSETEVSDESAQLSDESENDDWDCIDENNSKVSSNSDSECEEKPSLKSKIQRWAVDCGVTHAQLNKLLPILKELDSSMPLTAKTLLSTSDDFQCRHLSGGDYIYFGITENITFLLAIKGDDVLSTVELALNVDGVPLFHSSSYSLWPVLGFVTNIKPHKVFVISVFGGSTKPKDLEFLEEAIQELKMLIKNGIEVNGRLVKCSLKFCICDAPARAMIKATKLFSGYYGCDKCSQRGLYVGRMTYPDCDALLRTDTSFRMQSNTEHHHASSPFCSLPIDMISFFPIDYMHQVCLGVMKRLLVCWTSGFKKVKMSASQKLEVSSRLLSFRSIMTIEFRRKARSLNELPHWKATEFRSFLLYCGYFVLNKVVKSEILEHFMCLSVAMRIFLSETLSASTEHRLFAHNLMLHFVSKASHIYGPEFLVYNVHSLVHLSQEVEIHGNLNRCSAFIFENYMQQLKKCVRNARNPVVQVGRRLQEERLFNTSEVTSSDDACTTELCKFSCKSPNNCGIIAADGHCLQVMSCEKDHVKCMVFSNCEPVFITPCDSRSIGIFKAHLPSGVLRRMPMNILTCKAMTYAIHHGYVVFIQLLHSITA